MNKLRRVLVVMGLIGVCAWVWIGSRPGSAYEQIPISLPAGYQIAFNPKINDAGLVAGTLRSGMSLLPRIVVWDSTTDESKTIDLPAGILEPRIVDLNNAGQIIGQYWTIRPIPKSGPTPIPYTPITHSFFIDPTRGYREILSPDGGEECSISAINEQGRAVGEWNRNAYPNPRADCVFFWDMETGSSDPNIPGVPEDINSSGHIVGMHSNHKPFYWSMADGLSFIAPYQRIGWYYLRLTDQNEILGCSDSEGITLFRWNPVEGYHQLRRYRDKDYRIAAQNDRGQFMIISDTRSYFLRRRNRSRNEAFLYDPVCGTTSFGVVLLDSSSQYSGRSFDLNHLGWIVEVTDGLPDGPPNERTVLWIPKGKGQKRGD